MIDAEFDDKIDATVLQGWKALDANAMMTTQCKRKISFHKDMCDKWKAEFQKKDYLTVDRDRLGEPVHVASKGVHHLLDLTHILGQTYY